MNENNSEQLDEKEGYRGPWGHLIRGMWRTPLGVMGMAMVVISITLMLIGLIMDIMGLVENPYAAIATYMLLPGVMAADEPACAAAPGCGKTSHCSPPP